jgi:hypothetical protein
MIKNEMKRRVISKTNMICCLNSARCCSSITFASHSPQDGFPFGLRPLQDPRNISFTPDRKEGVVLTADCVLEGGTIANGSDAGPVCADARGSRELQELSLT